jgi:hypothetical protein
MKNCLTNITCTTNSTIDYNKQFLKMVRLNNMLNDKGG